MSIFTVGQLKLDLSRDVTPANPDDSRDINGAISQGTEELLSSLKPRDLSTRIVIENALYDQVNRYSCPDDLDTNKIMEWYRLKDNRDISTWFNPMTQVTNLAFSQQQGGGSGLSSPANIFTIEYQSGKKFIKVSDFSGKSGLTITEMNSVTENGTWVTFGSVNNLAGDNLSYVTGSGSIRFDITDSSNIGGIENFNIKPTDIKDFLNVGKVFTWVDLPNLKQLQTVTLSLYSSLTDYYEIQVVAPHDTDEFQLGWNLLGFELDRETMNTIGTPNPAAINHIKITFESNGTLDMNSVRVDNIVLRKGEAYGIQYVSNKMFQDVDTGLMHNRPQSDSNVIILEYNTYQVLRRFCASILAEELVSSRTDIDRIEGKKIDAVRLYKDKNKEQYIDETQVLRRFGVSYGYGYRGDTFRTRYNHDDTVND